MWAVVLQTFVLVFLAELGDKTQMAVLLQAGQSRQWIAVTLGAMLAFMLATLMAAVIGQLLGKSLPEKPLRLIAGALFIVLGAWVIWTTLSGKAD